MQTIRSIAAVLLATGKVKNYVARQTCCEHEAEVENYRFPTKERRDAIVV